MEVLLPSPANSSPLTPLGFLERASTAYTDQTSIVYNNKSFTWSQTHRRCIQLASSLESLDIKRGHVVSVVSPNTPSMYELQFGVPMSGAILNNINTRLDARTISRLLSHSESKIVFIDCQFQSLVLDALSLFPSNNKPPIPILIQNDENQETMTNTSSPSLPTIHHDHMYENLIKQGDPEFNWVRPESEWDPMVLNYTSGTTASPKGVVHSHRGLFIMTVDSLIDWSVPKQPVYLWTLPMFHANGWSYPWGMAAVGGTNICLRNFDAATIYDHIRKYNVTHMCGAPIVLNMLANAPDTEPLPHAVHFFTAGAPPPASVLFKAESLGFILSHGYGLTETAGPVVSCAWKCEWDRLPPSERAKLKARQGVRMVGLTGVDVVDGGSGVSVKRDGLSLGEVVLRGGSVMLGYLKDPTQTSECMGENGWLCTGDVGVMHPDGYLEIKDRSKDVIISGGENLSSIEVESVLYSHPLINEAAVVAQPNKVWGESPCAFVSLKSDQEKPSEKEIIEFCRARMPRYMVPRTIVFMHELPKTSTGKIQKFILREKAKTMDPNRMSRKFEYLS